MMMGMELPDQQVITDDGLAIAIKKIVENRGENSDWSPAIIMLVDYSMGLSQRILRLEAQLEKLDSARQGQVRTPK